MDKSLWRTACEEFLQISDLPVDQRGSYLGCLEPALRRGVESLLAADAEAEGFLDEPACPRHVTESLKAAARVAPELRLGPYHLERELSQSRMSRVFLARRDDGEYEKEVAVKVISYEAASEDLLERFRRERQILATLDHPNIARLLDGGTAGDGLPYLVMEYVEGTPIDEYCDHGRLSIRRRIELFLEVCSTVEYAHERNVVHRDLKASNILVSGDGSPKLLDFGIAKLLRPVGKAKGEVTSPGAPPMTPYYASPEQIVGEPITLATDTYSLGVLLFKLLSGRFPYRFPEPTPDAVKDAVLHQDALGLATAFAGCGQRELDGRAATLSPEAVSRDRRTTPAALRRELGGELEDIVRMALYKEPDRRYPRVGDLADDLHRYLADRPVAARGNGVAYRSRKFLTRNWQRTGIAVLLAWAVLALGALSHQSKQLAEERDQLARKQAEAETVVTFLEGMFKLPKGQRGRGRKIQAGQLLEMGARRAVQNVDHDPEVQARLVSSIGGMYADLGLIAEADQWMRVANRRLENAEGDALLLASGDGRGDSPQPTRYRGLEVHAVPLSLPDTPRVSASGAPSLSVAGTCPGEVSLSVRGATPGGSVLIVGAKTPGSEMVGKGPCAGTMIGLSDKRVAGIRVAGADGTLLLKRRLPQGGCAAYLQPVDYTTCKAGSVVRIGPAGTSEGEPTTWVAPERSRR